jgi:hypothetical protein
MTVQELIEQLQKFDPMSKVYTQFVNDYNNTSVSEVWHDEYCGIDYVILDLSTKSWEG